MASDIHNDTTRAEAKDVYTMSERSRFRFKSKGKRNSEDDDLETDHPHKKHRSGSHRHHHRHDHHRRMRNHGQKPSTTPDDPTLYDDTFLPNSRSSAYLDPETAFRESLFDALADDEGAAFWEGVYGQPIHTYSSVKTGPEGELERMTDNEYTAYVRARMYEKSHQHIIEERDRREQERKRRERLRKETEKLEGERRGFEKEVAESLRRGEERRDRKRWSARWESYLRAWQRLNNSFQEHCEVSPREKQRDIPIRDQIPWPVESGKLSDINKDSVGTFFRKAPADVPATLKIERVRWHPDKIQQRLGGGNNGLLDERTMRAVTAVFQIVDKMWVEERSK